MGIAREVLEVCTRLGCIPGLRGYEAACFRGRQTWQSCLLQFLQWVMICLEEAQWESKGKKKECNIITHTSSKFSWFFFKTQLTVAVSPLLADSHVVQDILHGLAVRQATGYVFYTPGLQVLLFSLTLACMQEQHQLLLNLFPLLRVRSSRRGSGGNRFGWCSFWGWWWTLAAHYTYIYIYIYTYTVYIILVVCLNTNGEWATLVMLLKTSVLLYNSS